MAAWVEKRSGELPVLITAPHGGTASVPGVPVRKSGTKLVDQHTHELALALWQRSSETGGRAPFLVLAGFHRNHIDANRPKRLAYEHAGAAAHYQAYHSAIRASIDQIRARWKTGVLIDLHGQAEEPDAIHLGTMNGRSVCDLLAQSGWDAYSGDDSFCHRYLLN